MPYTTISYITLYCITKEWQHDTPLAAMAICTPTRSKRLELPCVSRQYRQERHVRKPPRPCKVCGRPAIRNGRCDLHERQRSQRIGTSQQRGYDAQHEEHFRRNVLQQHPICCLCQQMPSIVADHYPHSRKALVRMGLDPNNPDYGRGLCVSCHNAHTSKHQVEHR